MSKVLSVRVSDGEAVAIDAEARSLKVSRQVVLLEAVQARLRPVPVESLGPSPSGATVERSVRAVTPQGPAARDNTVAMARQRRLNESSQRSRSK